MTWQEKNHICCGTFQNLNATNLKLTTREYAWPRMLSTTHQQVRSVAGIRLLYWMFIINNFKSGFNPRVLIGVGRLSSPYSSAIFWQDKSQKTQTVFTIFKNTNFSSILQWGWIYCFSDSRDLYKLYCSKYGEIPFILVGIYRGYPYTFRLIPLVISYIVVWSKYYYFKKLKIIVKENLIRRNWNKVKVLKYFVLDHKRHWTINQILDRNLKR